jgi:hypothetical protein
MVPGKGISQLGIRIRWQRLRLNWVTAAPPPHYNRPPPANPNKKRADFPKFFPDSLPPGSSRSQHADDFFWTVDSLPRNQDLGHPGECQ